MTWLETARETGDKCDHQHTSKQDGTFPESECPRARCVHARTNDSLLHLVCKEASSETLLEAGVLERPFCMVQCD